MNRNAERTRSIFLPGLSRGLAAILAFVLLSHAAVAAEDFAPRRLKLVYSNYLGLSSFQFELQGRTLVISDGIYSEAEKKWILIPVWKTTPTPAQWQEFQKEMDAVEVWKWRKNYIASNIMDGGGWELDLGYGFFGKHVKSAGSNAYPEAGGAPQKSETGRETSTFTQFDAALKKLAGVPAISWVSQDDRMMATGLPAIIFIKATLVEAIDFLRKKGTEGLRKNTGKKTEEMKILIRYDTTKPRPPVNYNRTSVSLFTALTEILHQQGLEFQVTGLHTITIVEAKKE